MRTVLTILLLAFLLIPTTAAQPGPPDHARPIEGVILVKFAPDALETPPQELRPNELNLQGRQAARLRRLLNARRGPGQKLFRNFTPADTLGRHVQTGERVRLKDLSRWYRFPVRDTTNVDSLAARLEALSPVLSAAPDYSGRGSSAPAPPRNEPNDSKFPFQWGYDDSDDHDVDAPEAWSLNTGRSDVTVAVLDGGVDLDHPDLVTDDGSRLTSGYDFANDDPVPEDDLPPGSETNFDDHGTPVAGTIGARTNNNQTGVAGLMWDLTIMPLKIAKSDGKTSKYSTWAEAVDYARENEADIINLSGGGDLPNDSPLGEAFYNAYKSGLVPILSAGNDGNNSVDYPALLHSTIAIGATDDKDRRCTDQRCGFGSNYGLRLDLVAPNGFVSTSRGLDGDLYDFFNGTSHSAPVVSGIAGLILSESRDEGHNLSNNDIVHLLERTAEDVNSSQYPGRDNRIGHGRVNAYEALRRLNDPYEVSHGSASFTKIYDDDKVNFVNGFTKENGTYYGAGPYICDIYELSASASSPEFYYEEKPWFWLPVTEKGFSAANPNDGSRYLSKSVSKSSAEATTYFYYVETNMNGQDIGWVPFDPTVHKRNGSFEYTVIGKPDTPPLEVTLSGPASLDSGQQGTWAASVSGGSGSTSYDWSYRPAGGSTWYNKSCTGSSCSHTFYGDHESGGMRVTVTKGSETDQATASVHITRSSTCPPDEVCIKAMGKEIAIRNPRVQAQDERTAELEWSTTSSLPGATFAVEHRADTTAAWSTLGRVPTSDSVQTDGASGPAYQFKSDQLEVGAHEFRLELQHEGAKIHTAPLRAEITLNEAYELAAYPNPVRNQATVELAVKKSQEIRVGVFDILGRRLTTIHRGPVPGQETRQFSLDASTIGLTSGPYFVRVQGETFTATRRITVVR